ncbi:bifunctional glutamate N-acetyltransferase/amino-acid acetyltransferase ArgJ [Lachnoclostridium phytofermentans]|uniref:bifunctional glutamate N-acetyltransferase/amino-acid acetyltransferase ArgJ n=1 Tax=Lachnoclostridium phytofermentans TaxID=66219 RepID=UPI00049815C5|nr:bifunctional glutamate N-acetyltransferase/amino-acid acetyltransferase ArgJ [uncultured Lachnoclostridium sp.]
MEIIQGGVTAAKGFKASGIYVGIKKKRKDMALVYSTVPAVGAGVFTTNIVKAAPVKWDINLLKQNNAIQAVVLNSGVANACTGELGDINNEKMAKAVADALSLPVSSILTASTGVIGKQLPIEVIESGSKILVEELSDTIEAGLLAAEAIMTTDTISKECAVSFYLGEKKVTVGGMSKGSGMIHPNMATMLGVVTTDVAISKEMLQEVVSTDVVDTFNMISVDRDTSTNDSLMVMANGLAENELITEKGVAYQLFYEAFHYVTETLAKMMAGDGEGASKLLEVSVINATSKEQAITLSKSIITSNLVKTTIFGNDANCGRFLCAMGYAGVEFDPDKVDLFIESSFGKLQLVENGMATNYSEDFASKILSDKEVIAIADMKLGTASAKAWGCDLTYDYVKINADYRS